jgi:nucleoside-diphosphate-sugar epimerase
MEFQGNSNNDNIKNILITGGGGFLGQAIVRRLIEKGHSVRSFNRRKYPELENEHVEQIQGDIGDPHAVELACEGIDLVFHVAAKTGFWGKYQDYYRTNTLGTRNVISACLKQGIRYLVYTSSPIVAYNATPIEGADESIPYPKKYFTHYQRTKCLAEQDVMKATSDKLRTIVLRPHLIWGPGDNQLVPRAIAWAKAKKVVQIGDGKNLVDTIYIQNAADAHILAAEKLQINPDLSGNVYFISQDEPIYLWDFINKVLRAGNAPPVKKSIPAGVAYALGAALEVIYKILNLKSEPKMTRLLANEFSQAHWFDISAAKRDLDYVPQVSIEEGLEHLKEWLESDKSSS